MVEFGGIMNFSPQIWKTISTTDKHRWTQMKTIYIRKHYR